MRLALGFCRQFVKTTFPSLSIENLEVRVLVVVADILRGVCFVL